MGFSLLKFGKRSLKWCANSLRVVAQLGYGVGRSLLNGSRADISQPLDRSVMVFGNGPSLCDIDLPAVKAAGIELACVNFFPIRHDAFWSLRPGYLFLLDPDFYAPTPLPEVAQLWAALEKVTWPMEIIVPQGSKVSVVNDRLRIVPLSRFGVVGDALFGLQYWLYRRNLVTVGFQNVVIGAGFYFITRRVPRLYYAGIDMSEFRIYHVDEDNRIYGNYVHSYGQSSEYQTDVAKGEFYRLLGMYQNMFAQFHYLALYARRQGVPVTNLSVDSYVDVFEKSRQFHKRSETI